jgi:hypothetical protein
MATALSSTVLFLAVSLGADAPLQKAATDLAIAPDKLLAKVEKYQLKHESVLVRFRVGSVGTEPMLDVASATTSQRIILRTGTYNAGKHASFDVAILPEAQAALRRLGITDFARHFTGKEVEIRGPLTSIGTFLYGSPAEWAYYVNVKSLEQFRSVKQVE